MNGYKLSYESIRAKKDWTFDHTTGERIDIYDIETPDGFGFRMDADEFEVLFESFDINQKETK